MHLHTIFVVILLQSAPVLTGGRHCYGQGKNALQALWERGDTVQLQQNQHGYHPAIFPLQRHDQLRPHVARHAIVRSPYTTPAPYHRSTPAGTPEPPATGSPDRFARTGQNCVIGHIRAPPACFCPLFLTNEQKPCNKCNAPLKQGLSQ